MERNIFENTLNLTDLEDLKNLNNDYNNYLFFKELRKVFYNITSKELQEIINETLVKENKKEEFSKKLMDLYNKNINLFLLYFPIFFLNTFIFTGKK